MTIRLAIAGIAGRMGRAVLRAALDDAALVIAGGSERAGNAAVGMDVGTLIGEHPLGIQVADTIPNAGRTAEVWVDFTLPEVTLAAVQALQDSSVQALIIGTTGFTPTQEAELAAAAQRFTIVRSGNFSLGVNVLAGLVRQAASILGPDWDIEILEAHHRRKIDAPSGTALLLGEAAAAGRGVNHEQAGLPPRHGRTGERPDGGIGYAVIRAGGIVGEHEVIFGSENEVVRLGHSALDRTIFAKGALRAAVWAANQPPGLYSMDDVLGF